MELVRLDHHLTHQNLMTVAFAFAFAFLDDRRFENWLVFPFLNFRGNNRAQRQSSTTAAESERQRQAKTNQQQSSDKGSNTPSTTRPQNDVVADDGNISTECAPATMTTIETSPTIDETVSSNRSPPGHETSISRKSQQLNERGCPIGNNFGGMIKSQSGPQRPQR